MSFAASLAAAQIQPHDSDLLATLASDALAEGEEGIALPLLASAAKLARGNARLWQWTGLLHRALDEHRDALKALESAARLAPADASIAHGRAHVALEAGVDAVALFDAAIALAPSSGEMLLGRAAARLAAGEGEQAAAELDAVLAANPMWGQGHLQLAQLSAMLGRPEHAMRTIDRALSARPRDADLWQVAIEILIRADRFSDLLATTERAAAATGTPTLFGLPRAIALSELGRGDEAEAVFTALGDPKDVNHAIRLVRHWLRTGQVSAALPLIDRWVDCPDNAAMWPYASIAWRLVKDPRWQWLEGDPHFVSVHDISDRLPPLDRLAELLRGLHRAKGRYLDQSVRGGTQTDGPLLSRIEPDIRVLRAAIVEAVDGHVAQLPSRDSKHPTLSHRRDRRIRFAGSWSVRLSGEGHHTNHVHPQGWISSALYIALPHGTAGEEGWLTLGEPQVELGLDLPPIRRIEPKPGQLVLFPSTMWHGTLPFAEGERLTVAFDAAPPR